MSYSTTSTPPINNEYIIKFNNMFKTNPPGLNKKLLDQQNKARLGANKEFTRRYGTQYDEDGNKIEK